MTAQGSAWPRLRSALDHGNLVEARSAASELEHVGLAEALELLLLICDQEPAKFERAALRWHARYCRDVKCIEPGEPLAALALLGLLVGKRAKPAAQALADLLYGRGTDSACEVLCAGRPAELLVNGDSTPAHDFEPDVRWARSLLGARPPPEPWEESRL